MLTNDVRETEQISKTHKKLLEREREQDSEMGGTAKKRRASEGGEFETYARSMYARVGTSEKSPSILFNQTTPRCSAVD
jgi:hypothetical protein